MTADIEPPLFETQRLTVRRLCAADVDGLLAVYGDGPAMRFVGDGRALTRAECEHWLEVTARNVAQRGYGMCAVRRRDGQSTVGFCGLVHPGGQVEAEVKYAFVRGCWGQGLASEVVPALLQWGFSRWGLPLIIATADPAHAASLRVLEKSGLQRLPDRVNGDGSRTAVLRIGPATGVRYDAGP